MHRYSKTFGLIIGPLLAVAAGVVGSWLGLTTEAQRVAAVATLMMVWWVTEAIPIYVTALLPAAL